MYRRTVHTLSVWAALKQEFAKIPAYFQYQAGVHVESAGKTLDFLKGDNPGEDPATREKRRKHKEMYDAICQAQQAKIDELNAKRKAGKLNMTWSQRFKANVKELSESLQQATSAQAGVMALLQHCTASHAAEVAIEQGINVENVQMVFEKQEKPNSVGYEEVVVGYIDAPSATNEEVMAFAEKLHKACPMANSMRIDWRQGRAPFEEEQRQSMSESNSSSSDQGTLSFERKVSETVINMTEPGQDGAKGISSAQDEVPLGMPGSQHRRRSASLSSSLPSKRLDDDDDFFLPGVSQRASTYRTRDQIVTDKALKGRGNKVKDATLQAEAAEKPPVVDVNDEKK